MRQSLRVLRVRVPPDIPHHRSTLVCQSNASSIIIVIVIIASPSAQNPRITYPGARTGAGTGTDTGTSNGTGSRAIARTALVLLMQACGQSSNSIDRRAQRHRWRGQRGRRRRLISGAAMHPRLAMTALARQGDHLVQQAPRRNSLNARQAIAASFVFTAPSNPHYRITTTSMVKKHRSQWENKAHLLPGSHPFHLEVQGVGRCDVPVWCSACPWASLPGAPHGECRCIFPT
jgi:hypothetical protein